MAAAKERLDQMVVEAGLAPTRTRARALVLAGRVLVDGERRDKPGMSFDRDARVELSPGKRPFASRGGEKLSGALDDLKLDVSGRRCLDVGASTGGFTDVLLRRGADHVTAVDVGRHLIDDALREDVRVRVVESLNARHMTPDDVDPPYDLATIDVSFISLGLILPAVVPLVPRGLTLALVKPQFEVGREAVGRGGVVRDDEARAGAVLRVAEALHQLGARVRGVRASRVHGPKGNREVFLLAESTFDPSRLPDDVAAIIREEVARADR